MRSTDRRARAATSGSIVTSKTFSRSDRSSLSGVIIFMYLQSALGLTAWKSASGVGLAQLVQHARLGGDENR